MKYNERSWGIEVIAYIKRKISNSSIVFQDATGEEGIKVESGRTNFPDVLLYSDKNSGIIFNGWELREGEKNKLPVG